MSARFGPLGRGFGYRFAPSEVRVVLTFTGLEDRRDTFAADVQVTNDLGHHLFRRHLNLKASSSRGSIKDLIDDLKQLPNVNSNGAVDWVALLREACESVMTAHLEGPPVVVISGEVKRPPPPAWLSQGLLLKNKLNTWLGAASTGKSTLAKAICAYYASGFRFLDRDMEQGTPLYLDWEDDEDNFTRVVVDVCRNLGAWPLPRMLWRSMRGCRLRDQIEMIAETIDAYGVGLVVLDAVAAAGGTLGEHVSYEAIASEMEHALEKLPLVTVLAIDHVTSAEHKLRGYVPLKARGSERKVEIFRNQWSLVTDEQAEQDGRHVVNWYQTKINVAAKEQPFATEIIHRPDEISIHVQPIAEPQLPAVAPTSETDRLLASLGDTWRTARQLALQVDAREPSRSRIESVRKLLERAVAAKRAVKNSVAQPPTYSCRQAGDPGPLNSLWGDPL